MADKPLPWFRAYPEAAFDPKFEIASIQTGMHPLIVFGAWWKILCIAGSSPIRGSLYVTAVKRYGNDEVTAMLRTGNDDGNKLLQAFIELDMLDQDEQGAYRVKNWEKRQFASDSSTERVKKHREQAKKAGGNVDETLHDRFSNGVVTPPEVDTEVDPETEQPLDPFDLLQQTAERQGILVSGPADIKAITDMVKKGVTAPDLLEGIQWRNEHNNGKPAQFISQISGPAITAMQKRLQNGSGKPKDKPQFAEVW